MKKCILLAAVALVASAACSKVETKVENAGQKAISFEVANYNNQTKANVAFNTQDKFHTYAWAYTAGQTAGQVFMNNAEIGYANSVWSPVGRVYYWPKTGYVNFFSYAYTPVPTFTEAGVATYGTANQPVKIAENDEALLADAAYHYSENVNEISGNSFEGVPTLFHHLLSKVTVKVLFDASGTSGYTWNVTVNSAKLTCADTGTLTVDFPTLEPDATTTAAHVWPFTTPGVNWVASEYTAEKTVPAQGATAPSANFNANGGNPIVLWNEISVLPQALTNGQKLELNLTLSSKYGNDPAVVETIDLTGENAIVLYAAEGPTFGQNIPAWYMNYKYVYTVTIKPNKTLTFDPAVVDWETGATVNYEWPEPEQTAPTGGDTTNP